MTHPEQTPDAAAPDAASPLPRRRAVIAVGSALVVGGVALAVWAVASTGSTAPAAQPTSPVTGSTASTAPSGASAAGSSVPAPAASTPPSAFEEGPMISAFSVEPTVAACPDDRASTVPLTFSWTSDGAERAWIGVGTSDASAQPAAEVDLSSDGFTGLAFACGDADQVFTLTVQGAGRTVSETIAMTRELD